jgi:hypothetical protein
MDNIANTKTFPITLISDRNAEYEFNVKSDTTIEDLKLKLFNGNKKQADLAEFIFDKITLENDKTLKNYRILRRDRINFTISKKTIPTQQTIILPTQSTNNLANNKSSLLMTILRFILYVVVFPLGLYKLYKLYKHIVDKKNNPPTSQIEDHERDLKTDLKHTT